MLSQIPKISRVVDRHPSITQEVFTLCWRQFSACPVRMDSKKEHLQQTANNFRSPGMESASVGRIWDASPTIKALTLNIDAPPSTSFKAGQWVDFFIPGEKQVGGFSMWNSPDNFNKSNNIELAVKKSTWAPAHWVHNNCKEGDKVSIRFGGDFFYDPSREISNPDGCQTSAGLLLIAGGVGINPLLSILLHARYLHTNDVTGRPRKVVLMYSATSEEELIFRDIIDCTCREFKDFSVSYHVTRPGAGYTGRITKEQIGSKLADLDQSDDDGVEAFLCGPKPMISETAAVLEGLGMSQNNIHFELWY